MLLNHYHDNLIEAGCDEAGRGCLAGSVFAAAVILPPDYVNADIDDSKKLTPAKRYRLRQEIIDDALAWAVGIVSSEEIDRINILNASILAMHRALDGLQLCPEAVIVDGNRFKPYYTPTPSDRAMLAQRQPPFISESIAEGRRTDLLPHVTVVKGDARYLNIAAAAILAKTFRDDYMNKLDREFPLYEWKRNKGYPTPAHRRAIEAHGTTPYHRLSFNLLPLRQLTFDFGETDNSE